jgi:transcriptional regulator with XRE-family HTH domain
MSNKQNLGLIIRKRRKELKITQEKLGDLVNLTPKYIQYIESGMRNPSLKTLDKLAKALGTKVRDLFPL